MHILSVLFLSLYVTVDVVFGFVQAIFPFKLFFAVSDTKHIFHGGKHKTGLQIQRVTIFPVL